MGLSAGVAQAEIRARFGQRVVHVHGLLGRNVQFVTQFAQVGDAHAEHPGTADIDFAHAAERKGFVRQVRRCDRLQQFPRARPLDVELGIGRGHVGDRNVPLAADMPFQPGAGVAVRRIGGDHHVTLLTELDDREVGLDAARFIEPLRVGDASRCAVHRVGRQAVEMRPGIAPLHQEFAHEGHVHQDHAFTAGPVLGFPPAEPVLAAPGQFFHCCFLPFRRIPGR